MVLHFVHSPIFKFHLGDYDDCKDANIIVITAGPSIRPGETPDRLKALASNKTHPAQTQRRWLRPSLFLCPHAVGMSLWA